jgi:predicted peroxiredoxin
MALVVQISKPPFGHENTFAGLYVASASLSKGLEVIALLMGDSVYVAAKGQIGAQKNIDLPPTEPQVKDIVELGGRVIADAAAFRERGMESPDIIEGIEVKELKEIQEVILDHGDKVVAF